MSDLASDGFWQQGPKFLREDFSLWPLKHDFKTEFLEGELQVKSHMAFIVVGRSTDWFKELLDRVSSVKKLYGIVSYLLRWLPEVEKTEIG